MSESEELKKRLSNILSTNAIDLFHALNEFGKKHDIKDEVTIHLLDDQIQMIEKETCRMFQIYFRVKLFRPLEDSKIVNKKN